MNVIGIKKEAVAKIDANPYRDLPSYPVIPAKIDALKSSIGSVGMWPSIIVRPSKDGRFEQAFGHQRMAAAKALGLKEVDVIVCNLSDEEMVKYMGRENGEDYSANFLIMLNTWEAGVNFAEPRNSGKAVEVARLLGWTHVGGDGYDKMNHLARACAGAHTLIEGGHIERKDLADISVNAARDIVERALSRMESIDQQAKLSGAKAKDISHAKKMVSYGVRKTAVDVRSGKIAKSQIRSQVDMNTLRAADITKERAPLLFAAFGHKLAESINKMLAFDTAAEKLSEIEKVLEFVVDESDKTILRQIGFELRELSARSTNWDKRLTTDKVKQFPAAAQIGGPSS